MRAAQDGVDCDFEVEILFVPAVLSVLVLSVLIVLLVPPEFSEPNVLFVPFVLISLSFFLLLGVQENRKIVLFSTCYVFVYI